MQTIFEDGDLLVQVESPAHDQSLHVVHVKNKKSGVGISVFRNEGETLFIGPSTADAKCLRMSSAPQVTTCWGGYSPGYVVTAG